MQTNKIVVFALLALLLDAFHVSAQQPAPVDVTPYVGLGSAGASPVGVAVTFPLTTKFSVESDVAYRNGEGGIHALSSSVSLLYDMPRVGRSTPYLATGIGLSQYGAPIFGISGPPIGTESRLRATMNAGGGLKTAINGAFDLRTDARWFKSFGKQGSEEFRVAQGLSFDVGKR